MTTDATPTPAAPSYGFDDAADNAIAHQIASKDPLVDIKGPVTLIGDGARLPTALPLSALSPEMRDPILRQLQGVPPHAREAQEAQLVTAALRQNSLNLRVSGGAGEGADPYWRETLEQEKRQGELNRQITAMELKLMDVSGYETIHDPVTGVPSAKAIDRYQGHDRKQMEAERDRLLGELQDLNGRGGALRLKEAMTKAVNAHKAIQTQLEEDRLAKVQAEEMLRQERIDKRAEAYAKHRRTVTG